MSALVPDRMVELDREAVLASIALVAEVTPADLARPTPCGDWSLADLLAHMTAQHLGFAAAAAGDGDDRAHWQVAPVGTDIVERYEAAARAVLAAFAQGEALAPKFALPEVGSSFRAEVAIGFHLVDYVVHSWDVARALDRPVTFSPELLEAALAVAIRVPDGPNRLVPGASFAPSLPAADTQSTLDQTLLRLGRSPAWPD